MISEYIDRQHNNTVCIAEFLDVESTDQVQPGDQFISEHAVCSKTHLPVLLTVEKVVDSTHIRMTNGGSYAIWILQRMKGVNE